MQISHTEFCKNNMQYTHNITLWQCHITTGALEKQYVELHVTISNTKIMRVAQSASVADSYCGQQQYILRLSHKMYNMFA